jgi:hypothetical protein
MRARFSVLAALAVGMTSAAIFANSGTESEARPKQRDFIIAGNDGYGTQECLSKQSSCGRIMADAWCEAKGFKSALAYRQLDRDEITGSTQAAGRPVDSFIISCKD